MKRFHILFFGALSAAALAGVGWWLFGWTTVDNPALGLMREQRCWGTVSAIHGDSNRDGKTNVILFGSNLDHTGFEWTEIWEDRDHDGNWDTWLVNTDSGTLVKIDLDRDGRPDSQFINDVEGDWYQRVVELRGW
jgi:hypothetical protein